MIQKIQKILDSDADNLLNHKCETIPSESLHLPGPDHVDRVYALSDRPTRVLRSLSSLIHSGRLAGTGYVSILPVDQGIEHSAGASFAPNPIYFDPGNIVELAIEGGCNGVASTLGVLGAVSRKYAHKIPFIMKFNHNEMLTYPNDFDQVTFASIDQAFDMGAVGVGATIYFGSAESMRQLQEVSEAFQYAHELGMCTILWCYLRNPDFKTGGTDYHAAADLTGQANHLGVTIEADIIKQKLPENNGGYNAIKFGKTHKKVYSDLTSDHPNRSHPIPGRQLLHGTRRIDQFRRRFKWRQRSERGCPYCGHQQAGWRDGVDLGTQGVPASDEGWGGAVERDSGCVPHPGGHGRLTMADDPITGAGQRTIYTVSEVSRRLKDLIEGQFGDVWIEGEVSNLRQSAAGHFYFTLKDDRAQLPAVCFRNAARYLRFKPRNGEAYRARGRLSIYEGRANTRSSLTFWSLSDAEPCRPPSSGSRNGSNVKACSTRVESGIFRGFHLVSAS